MKQFEYKVVKLPDPPLSTAEKLTLENYGKNGWELVSVVLTAPMTNLSKTIYYFKKEIEK